MKKIFLILCSVAALTSCGVRITKKCYTTGGSYPVKMCIESTSDTTVIVTLEGGLPSPGKTGASKYEMKKVK